MAKTKYKRTNNDLQKEIIMKQLTMRNISFLVLLLLFS
jgi:hypothetical protein